MPELYQADAREPEVREAVALRRAMRDLLALCTIPAAWVGRDPDAIANGVVDVLVTTLRADCGYLFLSGDIPEVRAIKGSLPENVLQALLAKCGEQLPRAPIVHDLLEQYRAVMVSIHVGNKAGVIAAVSTRTNFPTETESMLLSVASNQAAVSLEEAYLLTAQRRAQAELQEAAKREARLRAEADAERVRLLEIMEQAPAAMGLMIGPEHHWTYVNDFYVRITGRSSPAEFIGKTLEESLPEIELPVYRKLLDDVYRTGKAYSGREMKVTLNRAELSPDAYFDFVYQPIRDTSGEVEGILIHAVEVTDKVLARKKSQKAKRGSGSRRVPPRSVPGSGTP